MMEVAASDDLEIIVSNTTEQASSHDPCLQAGGCPRIRLPRLLRPRCCTTATRQGKEGALLILACGLIDNNGGAARVRQPVHPSSVKAWGRLQEVVNGDCTCLRLSQVDHIVRRTYP